MPLSIIFGGNTKSYTSLTTLPNLRTEIAPNVSMIIGQDGSSLGATLASTYGVSVPALGACLGSVSIASVNECIGWVNKFDIKNYGTLEYDSPAFGNGQLIINTTATLQTQLENNGYIFIRKFVGLAGSYFEDSPTAIAFTSDFDYIEMQRTIDKAKRGLYTYITLISTVLLI